MEKYRHVIIRSKLAVERNEVLELFKRAAFDHHCISFIFFLLLKKQIKYIFLLLVIVVRETSGKTCGASTKMFNAQRFGDTYFAFRQGEFSHDVLILLRLALLIRSHIRIAGI